MGASVESCPKAPAEVLTVMLVELFRDCISLAICAEGGESPSGLERGGDERPDAELGDAALRPGSPWFCEWFILSMILKSNRGDQIPNIK